MILASQSPRRRQLLEEAGFALKICPADIDEAARPDERPAELVRRLASEKAEACRQTLSQGPADGLLVAADTIVWSPELGVLGVLCQQVVYALRVTDREGSRML